MLPYKGILLLLVSLSLILPASSADIPVDIYGTGSLPGSGEPELPVGDVGLKDATEYSEDEMEDNVEATNSVAVASKYDSSDNSGNSDATNGSGDSDD